MTTIEAARIIGCTPQAVYHACLAGKLPARKVKTTNQYGFKFDIRLKDAEAYRDRPKGRGRPRREG